MEWQCLATYQISYSFFLRSVCHFYPFFTLPIVVTVSRWDLYSFLLGYIILVFGANRNPLQCIEGLLGTDIESHRRWKNESWTKQERGREVLLLGFSQCHPSGTVQVGAAVCYNCP